MNRIRYVFFVFLIAASLAMTGCDFFGSDGGGGGDDGGDSGDGRASISLRIDIPYT